MVALSGGAHATAAPSPARYRAEMNAMCRRTTVKLHTIEAELTTARNAGDARAYVLALGEYLGLGLREDATIEKTPVPASLRPVMAPVLSVLKRIDGHVRALDAARAIWHVEREQASRIAAGETLRAQTSFDEYLTRRANDFSYTFRQHLREIGGAIEE